VTRLLILTAGGAVPSSALVLVIILAAMGIVRFLDAIDAQLGGAVHDPDTVRTVLSTLAASMFTFIVFVYSELLVVVQLASSTLTPRIIGIVFRDPITKVCLMVFVWLRQPGRLAERRQWCVHRS
jgi:uncharacterized membrane protein